MSRKIDAAAPVVLAPVLEVPPYHYADLPTPTAVGARDHPAEWGAYFQRCMAAAGFHGVEQIKAGSQFVSAHSLIGNRLLELVVREAFEGSGLPGFPLDDRLADYDPADRISALSGGLALFVDGEPLVEPSCCGDLGNVDEWAEAVATRPSSGAIWIGHPELRVAFAGEKVTLTEQWDQPPPPPEYLVEVTMPVEWLATAVQVSRLETERFRLKLKPMVTRLLGNAELAETTSKLLVGAV